MNNEQRIREVYCNEIIPYTDVAGRLAKFMCDVIMSNNLPPYWAQLRYGEFWLLQLQMLME